MTRCALCLAHHDNTTVCDDCAERVAHDIDCDPEGVGQGVAETLRAILRAGLVDVAPAIAKRNRNDAAEKREAARALLAEANALEDAAQKIDAALAAMVTT